MQTNIFYSIEIASSNLLITYFLNNYQIFQLSKILVFFTLFKFLYLTYFSLTKNIYLQTIKYLIEMHKDPFIKLFQMCFDIIFLLSFRNLLFSYSKIFIFIKQSFRTHAVNFLYYQFITIQSIIYFYLLLHQPFMFFLFILLSIFDQIQSPLTPPPPVKATAFFSTSNSVQAGIIDLSNINQNKTTYTYYYDKSFSSVLPKSALSITGMQTKNPLSPLLGFKVKIDNQMLNGIQISYLTYNNTQFNSFKVSFFSGIQNDVYVDYQEMPTVNLKNGTGQRTDNFIFSNPGNIANLYHKNYMMPFLTAIIMNKGNSSNFQLAIKTFTYDTNNYSISLTTQQQTLVNIVDAYVLLYDETAIQETQSVYIDSIFMTKPGILNLVYSNSVNFFSGISSYNFDKVNFNFFMNNYSLESNSSVNFLNYSTWNLRLRNCNSTAPYYLHSEQMCYKNCPSGYMTNSTYSFCQKCFYSCTTCTTSLYNGCLTCTSTWKRTFASGQCRCMNGYYDDGVNSSCSKCHYTCSSCNNVSTNCTSCVLSNYRTLNNNTCSCNLGYYDNNISLCVSCNILNSNCLSCNNLGCLTCPEQYFLTNINVCQICDYTCSSCSKLSTNCTSCLNSNYRTLNNNKCLCSSGYYDNNNALCASCNILNCLACTSLQCYQCEHGYFITEKEVKVCSSCHYSCFTCNQIFTNCTSCLSINFRSFNDGSCPCDQYYFDNSKAICDLCSQIFINCLSCTNESCSICTIGYYKNMNTNLCQKCDYSCTQCNIISTNCTSCLNQNYRILINNACPCERGYFDNNATVCVACSTLFQNCDSCTQNSCLTCVSHYFYKSSSCQICNSLCLNCFGTSTNCTSCVSSQLHLPICNCTSGYYFNSSDISCKLCSSIIKGCNQCVESSICLKCQEGLILYEMNCKCLENQYYNQIQSKCNNCKSQCLSCQNSENCTSCNQSVNLYLIDNNCTCNSSFTFNQDGKCVPIANINSTCIEQYFFDKSKNSCEEICGDGKLHILDCDDGNNIDGDGCSKQCKIEKDYKCEKGQPSVCTYNGSIDFFVEQIQKSLYSNSLKFIFQFLPYLNVFSQFNFSQNIKFNRTESEMKIAQYKHLKQKKQIHMVIDYNTNLQNQYINISLKYQPNKNQSFKLSNISYKVQPNPQAIYHELQFYNSLSHYKYFIQTIIICNYIVILFDFIFLSRKASLQTIFTLQLSIIILSFVKPMPAYFSPLTDMATIVNGYNKLYENFPGQKNINYISVDQKIKILGYTCDFFSDINYMIILEIFIIGFGFIIFMISKFLTDSWLKNFIKIYNYFINQLGFALSIFNSLNLGFCIGIQIMFNSESIRIHMLFILIVRILQAFFFIKKYKIDNQYNDTKLQQLFPLVICCQRFIFGLVIGLSINHKETLFGLMILQIIFVVYLAKYKQYRTSIIPILGILNQLLIVIIIISIILITYKIDAQFCLFVVYMLCLTLLVVIQIASCIIYILKQKCKSTVTIFPQSNQNNNLHLKNQVSRDIIFQDLVESNSKNEINNYDISYQTKSKITANKFRPAKNENKQ